jgi:N-glycosidase YbiA
MKIQHLINNWPGTINNSENTILKIRKVDETYGWMGNMSNLPVRVEGVRYPTTEHLFQSMRFEDEGIRREIRESKSPMSSKMVMKKHREKITVTPRSGMDLDLMRTVLRIKLEFYPKLREELMKQDSESIIIEDCTKRSGVSSKFWGMKLVDGEWVGENWLGRLWMEVRLELQGYPSFRSLDTSSFPGSLWMGIHEYFSEGVKLAA